MNGNDDLSQKDITFLRAIRDINESPERFASTAQGVTPATVTAITAATMLPEEEVEYRLNHPQLGKSGLVKVYEAGPPDDDSANRNSAELTKAGERALAEAEADGDEPTTGSRTAAGGRANADPATTPDAVPTDEDDRIAALEERIEQLEAESGRSQQPVDRDHEQVAELAEEVAALRETTDRLASKLDDALHELDAIRDSEYGALDEKREEQFETAVKSMVAFHQLATEVLDVRVENYEPAAGRADPERVETTRNRIGDALGVGKSGGGSGTTLDAVGDDSDWPDPEEVERGGRVFSDAESVDTVSDDRKTESDAPESGLYPPIGGDEDNPAREPTDEDAEASTAEAVSDVPESGVYPPIGGDDTDEGEDRENEAAGSNDGSLPESVRPDTDDPEVPSDPWRLSAVDPAEALAVRDAVASVTGDDAEESETTSEYDDPYPDGEAYARIVDEAPTGNGDREGDIPAVVPTGEDSAKVRIVDGQAPEAAPTDDDD